MDAIENLLSWAQTQGITVSNVGPRALPGRGIGIVVTSPLKKDDTILDVPIPCLKTIATTPKPLTRPFPKETHVHALLALDIALDASPSFKTWSAVFPTPQDLSSCPLTWSASSPTLASLLPSQALTLLKAQREKFESHWSLVSSTPLPDPLPQDEEHQYRYPEGSDGKLTYESYLHAWLLVNSRTFYHVTPKTAKRHRDDHMILQPVADLLNHASRGCSVAFDKHSFTIKADRAYAAGEEIHICYGRHSNDFLLVEYGFVMNQGENEWDEVCIDDLLLPRLGAAHRRRLEERGFLGNYVIDAETVCYRTQVALRTLVLPARRWAQFVDGFSDGEAEQPEVDALLREMLSAYNEEIESKIETVRGLDEGQQFQRDMVVARWKQIQLLVRGTIDKLKASNTQ
ncbi:SET domain-containing protein [Colletotrichum scovillei]|uniref:SET domain-containing protein n=1 Tax=Colletotrichum scovillei TaxID=1209932 RepID=A0A9P7R3T3_9PEZI|nr:SET domain-containing protein [Colletotrichum scovillei]KAG7066126.1 SET domain-containing protein [Colletotrichum scovillei]KAG7068727.1 SET domain-containing protein [Colletotrichum scovillei]